MKVILAAAAMWSLLPAQEFHVGAPVADFALRNLDAQEISYAALKGGVTVVAFISTQCPVSNAYNERMNALYRDFGGRVKFIFVNANANESAEDVRRHARAAGLDFPVYKDVNNIVADRFGAQATPETYVIDSSGTLRYHGSVDDSQNPARIKHHSLRDAMEAVLAGKNVTSPENKAFGCTIKRVRRQTQ